MDTAARTVAAGFAVQIRALDELGELQELEAIFDRIWQRDGTPPLSTELMRALSHSGNYVTGAWAEGRLVGGLVGFLGRSPDGALHLHSHILGVLPELQLRGAGFALKQHQRAWARERGIAEITWTFDPLVRRNGYFNVCKLGAALSEYHVDFYGSMGDGINGAGASDRAVALWRLDSERAVRAAAGDPPEPQLERLIAGGATVTLREAGDGTPVLGSLEGDVLLCQAPGDIVELRARRPALAEEWREALRASLATALDRGYQAVGMTRSGWYVLRGS